MQNEPVAVNGIVAVLTAALTPVLARWGIDASGTGQIVGLAGAVIAAGVSVWRIVAARSKVSPVKPPPIGTTGPPAA